MCLLVKVMVDNVFKLFLRMDIIVHYRKNAELDKLENPFLNVSNYKSI